MWLIHFYWTGWPVFLNIWPEKALCMKYWYHYSQFTNGKTGNNLHEPSRPQGVFLGVVCANWYRVNLWTEAAQNCHFPPIQGMTVWCGGVKRWVFRGRMGRKGVGVKSCWGDQGNIWVDSDTCWKSLNLHFWLEPHFFANRYTLRIFAAQFTGTFHEIWGTLELIPLN